MHDFHYILDNALQVIMQVKLLLCLHGVAGDLVKYTYVSYIVGTLQLTFSLNSLLGFRCTI